MASAVGLRSLPCRMEMMAPLPGSCCGARRDDLRVRGLVLTAIQSPIFFSFLEKGLALGCGLGLGDLLSVLGKAGSGPPGLSYCAPLESGSSTPHGCFYFWGGAGLGVHIFQTLFPWQL